MDYLKDLNTRLYLFKLTISEAEEKALLAKCTNEVQYEAIMFLKTIRYHTSLLGFTVFELSDFQREKYKEIWLKTKIPGEETDISESAFNDTLENFITDDKSIMENVVNPFLLDNMCIDFVLDKIGKTGMKSLRPVELEILKSQSDG